MRQTTKMPILPIQLSTIRITIISIIISKNCCYFETFENSFETISVGNHKEPGNW